MVLQLLALNISDILNFEFMDQPPHESLVNALEQLHLLGAVGKKDHIQLTALGRDMAHLPLHPQLAKAILSSREFVCRCVHSWECLLMCVRVCVCVYV